MMQHCYYLGRSIWVLIVAGTILGCQPASPRSTSQDNTPTPEFPAVQIQQAYQLADPEQRRIAVTNATAAFLRSKDIQTIDDRTASLKLTEAAFSSGTLIFTDPGYVARNGGLAVISLPNGLGLYLYDLRDSQSLPVELSAWTVGISNIHPSWHVDEVGVIYNTLATDNSTQGHFVLAKLTSVGWRVAWFSDDTPDWWFNASNAVIDVTPDLSRFVVTGEALGSTAVFDETGNSPRRKFLVEWQRDHDRYKMAIPLPQQDRHEWMWRAAQPSAYATLVEFIERVRQQDHEGARNLASDPSVVDAAFAYGLYLGDSTFHVTAFNQDRITFQGRQGAFIANFRQSDNPEGTWVVTSILPLGAEPTAGPPIP